MVITYHGGECFKVVSGGTTLVFNPPAKGSRFAPARFGADVALVSLNHPDFNGIEQVTYADKTPFVISGPGEYEVGELTARGVGVRTLYDGEERFNTLYQVALEGITLVFLGAFSSAADAQVLEQFSGADILFTPIGGGDVLDSAASSALGVRTEARLVIPMHYDEQSLRAFLKEEGAEGAEPQEKLVVKKKDLAGREGDIVVLRV